MLPRAARAAAQGGVRTRTYLHVSRASSNVRGISRWSSNTDDREASTALGWMTAHTGQDTIRSTATVMHAWAGGSSIAVSTLRNAKGCECSLRPSLRRSARIGDTNTLPPLMHKLHEKLRPQSFTHRPIGRYVLTGLGWGPAGKIVRCPIAICRTSRQGQESGHGYREEVLRSTKQCGPLPRSCVSSIELSSTVDNKQVRPGKSSDLTIGGGQLPTWPR